LPWSFDLESGRLFAMQLKFAVASLLFAACGGLTTVDVSPLGKSPHALKPRAVASVQIFKASPPAGAVEVYLIKVSGGEPAEREAAAREQAAQLGCDGLVLKNEEGKAVGEDGTTGSLVDHRTMVTAHARAVCVVFAGDTAAAPAAPVAPTAPTAPETSTGGGGTSAPANGS
jgi:hypothetical protein